MNDTELIEQSKLLDEPLQKFLMELSEQYPDLRTIAVGAVLLTYGMQMYASTMRGNPQQYTQNVLELASKVWEDIQNTPPIEDTKES